MASIRVTKPAIYYPPLTIVGLLEIEPKGEVINGLSESVNYLAEVLSEGYNIKQETIIEDKQELFKVETIINPLEGLITKQAAKHSISDYPILLMKVKDILRNNDPEVLSSIIPTTNGFFYMQVLKKVFDPDQTSLLFKNIHKAALNLANERASGVITKVKADELIIDIKVPKYNNYL